ATLSETAGAAPGSPAGLNRRPAIDRRTSISTAGPFRAAVGRLELLGQANRICRGRSRRIQAQPGRQSPRGPTGRWPRRRSVDRSAKHALVAALHQTFMSNVLVVVTHNAGMTVAEVTNLRRQMRQAGAGFKVTKNRLARLALEGTAFEGLSP